MAARGTKSGATIGFLTVVEDSQHGAFGGFLVLNAAGRPLEFHCTTPVKPNRAQEILYGPTLRPYLYGEQIGTALVAKAAATLELLCVDLPDVLAVRPHVQLATVLVAASAAMEQQDPPATLRIDDARCSGWHAQNLDVMGVEAPPSAALPCSERVPPLHAHAPRLHWFDAGPHRLAVHHEFAEDRAAVAAGLESLTDFDLAEPFGRIREAIEEAQRGSR
jgi:hypothetical protein